MILELRRLDGENCSNETHRFTKGQHILGRSDFKCTDKRISRRHFELNIKDFGDIQLTSLHQNGCYHRLTEKSPFTVIETGLSVNIKDSECIGLLPDAFWYKLTEIKTDTEDSESLTNNNCVLEKVSEASNEDVPEKIDADNEVDSCKTDNEPPSKRARSDSPIDIKPNIEELQNTIVMSSTPDQPPTFVPEIKTEPTDIEIKPDIGSIKIDPSDADQSTSTSRNQCSYGSSCYRQNPQHKVGYSHPGDPDWSNQAACPWGASCYRRNPQHRKDFSHPGPPAQRPQQPSPTPVAKEKDKKRKRRKSWSGSESDNEYDSEDPFLAADSSDDYVPSNDDSFSSDKSSEEDEEINLRREYRRLKRKAKKIISK